MQKKRGELGTQSGLLDQMMAHQEKRDAHETKLATLRNDKTRQRGNPAAEGSDTMLRLRAGVKNAKPQAAVD